MAVSLCAVVTIFVISDLVHTVFVNSNQQDNSFLAFCIDINCTCYVTENKNVMDCTGRHVNIETVCKLVDIYNISILRAGENNFGRLKPNMMNGCEHLSELDIHYNQIGYIHNKVFTNFTNLSKLDLRANNLEVYNETFNLSVLPPNLRELYLGGNVKEKPWEQTFQYPALTQLPSLSTLYMDGLPANFGKDYSKIKVLSLSACTRFTYCNITYILNSTLSNLQSLEILNLSCCNVRSISAGAFENLKQLRALNLSVNIRLGFDAVTTFSYGLQFTKIEQFDYSRVYATFGAGTVLKKEHMCFFRNTSLKELSLNGNNIAIVEPNAALLVPPHLEKLQFNDNKPIFGPYLSQLGCLAKLKSIQANFQNKYHSPLRYLVDLDRDHPNITKEPATTSCDFMSEENLRQVVKGKTNCHYIEEDDFKEMVEPTFPQKVTHVEFKDCKMDYDLDITLQVKPANNSLEYADFSGNSLHTLDGSVGPFPRIKKVILSRNYCEHVGQTFFNNLTTSEYLDLSNNYLGPFFTTEESKTVFSNLKHLQELNLGANKIVSIFSETLAPLRALKILSIQQNNIQTFGVNVSTLDNLLVLDLRNNSLTTLPLEVRSKLVDNSRRLGENFSIDLSGNFLKFECDNRDFLKWIYGYRVDMKGFDKYIYTTGVTLSKTSLANLERSCKSYTIPIIVGSIVLAVFLSILIVGIVYRNRWKIRYFLYMSKMGIFGYQRLTEVPDENRYSFDAFISYAEENLDFIKNEVIPTLEGQDQEISLCVHQRDFVAGNAISENIIDAIRKSKKTVIILSKSFIKRKWCMYEFNMARMESIYSRDDSNHIVIVMMEDIPSKDMPLEMVEWIKDNSYIEYTTDEQGQLLFWVNLRNAITT